MDKPNGHKILVADDERVARTMLVKWLQSWGYEVIVATDGQEALDRIAEDKDIRLALLDWIMPKVDGVDVVRKIRAGTPEPYIYTVLLTARDDKKHIVEGLDAGADDYLVKPADPLELKVRLRAGSRVVELQEELMRAREAMRFEATHDALTGMPNRSALMKNLKIELTRSARGQHATSILFADIDHFKKVNDTYGHGAGDIVLCEVGKRLMRGIRAYDQVGRLGGEEFLVVLPECDARLATLVGERLRRLVGASPILAGGAEITCTVSIGAAGTDQKLGVSPVELLEAADAALYRAKGSGRNRLVLATTQDFGKANAPVSTRPPPETLPS
ncbi:MAG: diguanylate cyclase [Polyangiaceae bacterium]|nr:diguanylate cyclase [Polyangiaceae bacterium]